MTPPTAAARIARAEETFQETFDGVATPAAAEARPEAPRLRAVPASSEEAAKPSTLWRNGRFEADEWAVAADGEAVGEGPAIVPLKRFLAEHEALAARSAPLGVIVEPGEKLDELVPLLSRVALVALPFPKFSDGRSMSTARLLRERHGFGGEIRATGEVLIDLMPLMRRCGVDAFTVESPIARRQLAAGLWPDVPFYMQPLGSTRQAEQPAGARPWARRPAA